MNAENGARQWTLTAATKLGTFPEAPGTCAAKRGPFPCARTGRRSLARLTNGPLDAEMSRPAYLLSRLVPFWTLGVVSRVVLALDPPSKGRGGLGPLALH